MPKKKVADFQADGLDKNKTYAKDLRAAIEDNKDHPLFHGIIMQAHHLISSKGAKNCGFKQTIIDLNYDINTIMNLVFLPSTLEGACHLGVQVHRGDHKQVLPDGKNYHDYVSTLIGSIQHKINDCKNNKGKEYPIQDYMNDISLDLLRKVAKFQLPLSFVHKNFKKKSLIGCCNFKKIGDVRKAMKNNGSEDNHCNLNRNHFGHSHAFSSSGKNSSEITYPKSSYELKVGQ